MTEVEEIWATPPKFSHYRVSNFEKIVGMFNGIFRSLTPYLHSSGYMIVSLTDDNGKPSTQRFHRIVASAFLPNPEEKPIVYHINGIRNDNKLDNLKWVTVIENSQDKITAKKFKGKVVVQYDLNGNMLNTWQSVTKLEETLKISRYRLNKACINGNLCEDYYWRYLENIAIEGETWKSLTIREHNIMASSKGRIQLSTGTVTFGHEVNTGYRAVHIGNKIVTVLVHRFICMAFHPINGYEKYEDYERENNEFENLEWVTSSENNLHSKARMNLKCNEPVAQLNLDGTLIAIYPTIRQASKNVFMSDSAIRNACDGKSRSSGGYKWSYMDFNLT